MTIHSLVRRAIHRIKAKRLHGVHSPFVYHFSEAILASPYSFTPAKEIQVAGVLSPKYRNIIAGILQHYHYSHPVITRDDLDDLPVAADVLILSPDKPGNWVRIFNKHYLVRQADCLFIVCGIHNTRRHSAKWRRLHQNPKVLLSIDLYGIGLLWFRADFKEKQHFVLQ